MDGEKIKSADAASPSSIHEKHSGIFDSRSSSDVEKGSSVKAGETVQLKRKLQSRHLQMIAIGMS